MDLSSLPDIDDHYIGEAILTIMFVFMFVWLTSAASPIQFPGRDTTWRDIVNHFTFILYLVVPIAILGIIESFYGAPKSGVTIRIDQFTQRIRAARKEHMGKYGRFQHDNTKQKQTSQS